MLLGCGDVLCDVFAYIADDPSSQHELRRTCRAAAGWYDVAAGSYKLFPFFAISPAVEMAEAAAAASARGRQGAAAPIASAASREGAVETYRFDDSDGPAPEGPARRRRGDAARHEQQQIGICKKGKETKGGGREEAIVAHLCTPYGDMLRAYSDALADGKEEGELSGLVACTGSEETANTDAPFQWKFCPVALVRTFEPSPTHEDSHSFRVGPLLRCPAPSPSDSAKGTTGNDSYINAVVVPTLVVNLPLLSDQLNRCPPAALEPRPLRRNEELRALFAIARARGNVCGLFGAFGGGSKGGDDRTNAALSQVNITDVAGFMPPRRKRRPLVGNSAAAAATSSSGDAPSSSASSSSLSSSDDDEDEVFDPAKYGLLGSSPATGTNTANAAVSEVFDDNYDPTLWLRKDFLRGINARAVLFLGGERLGKCGHNFLSRSGALERLLGTAEWRNVTDLGRDFLRDCPRLRRCEMHKMRRLMTLRDGTFANCVALRSVTFPPSVTDIGDDFMRNCGALRAFDISNARGLRSIGHGFLSRCHSLLRVSIVGVPLLESVGKDCLFGAASLRRLTIDTAGSSAAAETVAAEATHNNSDEASSVEVVAFDEGLLKGCPQLLSGGRGRSAAASWRRERRHLVDGGGWAHGAEADGGFCDDVSDAQRFCTTDLYIAMAPNANALRFGGAANSSDRRVLYSKRPPMSAFTDNSDGGDGDHAALPSHLRRVSHEEFTGRRAPIEEEAAGCVVC